MRVGTQSFIAVHRIKNSISREALGSIAVCFSCDGLINSISLSVLQPTIRVPARPQRDEEAGSNDAAA